MTLNICDSNDTSIPLKGTIANTRAGVKIAGRQWVEGNKQVTFKT